MGSLKPLHFDRGNATSGTPKNTGKKKQDHYHATVKYILTKESFGFDTYADARLLTKMNEAKISKDIVVMFDIQSSENANVEATYYEAGNIKVETKALRKGLKAKHHLGLFGHAAMKSYQDSGYTRIVELTRDGKMLLVVEDDKLKGQLMSNFIVGAKIEPVIEGELASTTVEVVYDDYNQFEDFGQVIKPDYRLVDLEGIFDLNFVVESASATEIKFKAYTLDGEEVVNLVLANFKFLKADNTAQSTVAACSYTEGSYVATGTGIVTGTINTTGVIDQTKKAYEGVQESFTVS